MATIVLHDNEFMTFQKLIFNEVGISLDNSKKLLVQTRLLKRLLFFKLNSYLEYLRLVQTNANERTEMINLITTNETYFFREIEQFEFLQKKIIPEHPYKQKLRFWSAAASVGAEAYSAAMLLDSMLARNDWEVVGTDINTEVVHKARVGLYPKTWADKIPMTLKKRYCLKGKGKHQGKFLIDRNIIGNITFETGNLLNYNSEIGKFDVIFLRNVLIYFNDETKQTVVNNVLRNLNTGGYLFISLTENLNKLHVPELEQIETSIYKKIK